MSKADRMRVILNDFGSKTLPDIYDNSLLGIYHQNQNMFPVYSYLKLVEVHMKASNSPEEESVNFIEAKIISNSDFIVVDDTGV